MNVVAGLVAFSVVDVEVDGAPAVVVVDFGAFSSPGLAQPTTRAASATATRTEGRRFIIQALYLIRGHRGTCPAKRRRSGDRDAAAAGEVEDAGLVALAEPLARRRVRVAARRPPALAGTARHHRRAAAAVAARSD